MKAAQIEGYSKSIQVKVREVPVPEIGDSEVLIKVMAAAVNPVDLLILSGGVRLIQRYVMPLTLGNECAGIVEKRGRNVSGFQVGERVYARLPIDGIGAFAEYVAVDQQAVAPMPKDYDFETAAAIPLTGLTAYQAFTEELEAKPGRMVLITGGSGSFGELAVPIAKALGLYVVVCGNGRAEEHLKAIGADRYIDYRKENYWEVVTGMDYVVDTLGVSEFEHALSVLKPGGRMVSLRAVPNRAFARNKGFALWKRLLFSMAGAKYDRKARKQGKEYRFIFVRSDGAQLRKVTEIVEERHVVPRIAAPIYSLDRIEDALRMVAQGHPDGKVVIRF